MRFAKTLSGLFLPRRYALAPETRCGPACDNCLRFRTKSVSVTTSAFGLTYNQMNNGHNVVDGTCSTGPQSITGDCDGCSYQGPCGTVNALSIDCAGFGTLEFDAYSGSFTPLCGGTGYPGCVPGFGTLGNWDMDVLNRLQGQLDSQDFDAMPWNSCNFSLMETSTGSQNCGDPQIVGGPDWFSWQADPDYYWDNQISPTSAFETAYPGIIGSFVPYYTFQFVGGGTEGGGAGVTGAMGYGGAAKTQIDLAAGWACSYTYQINSQIVDNCACANCPCGYPNSTGTFGTPEPCSDPNPDNWTWKKYTEPSIITLDPGPGQYMFFFLFPRQCTGPCVDIQEFAGRCCHAPKG